MSSPEPVPCMMCFAPIYPGQHFCSDQCEREWQEMMSEKKEEAESDS